MYNLSIFMKTNQPFIPVARPVLRGNESKYLEKCITSGWVSSKGSFIDAFEQRFSAFAGTRYALTASSGTTALHLALLGLGIGPGDEVIVPALTFSASAATVVHAGAMPVFVDVRRDTWNIDESLIPSKITAKTRALMAVHLYGYPAAMNVIQKIAREHNLKIIEDAAEAQVSRYNGRPVGSLGDVGCFSFFGNKIITTGEGGMCTTNDKAVLDRMALYKNHGMTQERRYWHTALGYNYRLTNLQAAVGLAQMEQLDEFAKNRKRITEQYNSLLSECPYVSLPSKANDIEEPIYWMYCISLQDEPTRDALAEFLAKSGVETRPVFPPLIDMPIYKKYTNGESFPIAAGAAARGLSLPTSSDLTDEEITYIVNAIKTFFNQYQL